MQLDISKLCTDFLRVKTQSETNEKLKATHARELTAAFFGYNSHAALLAENEFPLHLIETADVFIPDVTRMDERRQRLEGLPSNLPSSQLLAEQLADYLKQASLYTGSVWWPHDTMETYIIEDFLPNNDYVVWDDLSGEMAETNALFDETYYEEAEIYEEDGHLTITVTGQCNGTSDQDKPFSGDQIDMTVTIEMSRIAGRNSYSKPSIKASGNVNWDWAEMDAPEDQSTADREDTGLSNS